MCASAGVNMRNVLRTNVAHVLLLPTTFQVPSEPFKPQRRCRGGFMAG